MSDKKQRYALVTLFVCLTLFVCSVAYAHKVRVFAYGEGDTIIGETAFSGGRAAKGSQITVRDAKSDKILSNCLTDDNGNFHFKIPEDGTSRKQAAVKTVVPTIPKKTAVKQISTDDERIRKRMEEVLDKKLASIKHLLAKSQDRGPTLQDILGGIGYLLGLAGIAAYMKSRKKE